MADLKLTWSQANGNADLTVSVISDDLETDGGLETAVLISLFTNRRADADDEVPGTDRGGWWADEFALAPNDRIGSRLWLLDRAKKTSSLPALAEEYAAEALQWLVDDLVAESVVVVASLGPTFDLELEITIKRPELDPAVFRFTGVWEETFNPTLPVSTALTALELLNATTALEWDYAHPGVKEDIGANEHDLSLQSAATDGDATTGLVAGNGLSEVAFNFGDDAADAADFSDTDVCDTDGTSQLVAILFKGTTKPSVAGQLWGKRMATSPFYGAESWLDSVGRVQTLYNTTAESPTIIKSTDHLDGDWHLQLALVDADALTLGVATDLDAATTAAITAHGSSGSGSAVPEVMAVGEQRRNSAEIEVALYAVARGAQVEGIDLDLMAANLHALLVV